MRYLAARGEHVDGSIWEDRDPVEILSDLVRQAQARGHKDPQAWAQATLEFLQEQSRPLVDPARQLLSSEDQLCELMAQAKVFADRHLPMLMSLGVV